MSERVTYGFQLEVTDLGTPTEPIDASAVKSHLGIGFTAHDAEINRLITACRKQVEKKYHKSLIGHSVSVLWLNFYDDEPLPYLPFADTRNLTVTDLDGVTIASTEYKLREVGGSALFVGDFPNGVKLTYDTKALSDTDINNRLIQAVGFCFRQDMTAEESVKKAFKGADI